MNIRDVEKTAIVDIAGNAMSQSELELIQELFEQKASGCRIAINLKNVDYITDDFIKLLKRYANEKKLSLFGLNNDIYLMLFITQSDKYADIYLNEQDFMQNKNIIVHRRLKLLKSA